MEWRQSCVEHQIIGQLGGIKRATMVPHISRLGNLQRQRSATITVKCGTITSNLSITQEPRPHVTIASHAINLAATAGKSTFILKSNVDWTIESDAPWCIATPTSGKKGTTAITITAEANTSKAERTAQLIITASDDKTIITVTQAAK